jgi:LysR family transcriptional regulator, benzoate and cis,cis-muconate-responsive activator of ben and cat genes
MDLRQLRYFVMVANERNFTRAAEKLNIAQPPLSRQIQQLEAMLGTALIDRETRPLRLTAMGHLFYDHAVQVLNRMAEIEQMMAAASKMERRRFVIGFVASTIYARLPALIRQFRQLAPDVDLSLVELGSLEQITALKDGKIDVGFGRIRFDDEQVVRTILREERLVVAVPFNHRFAQQAGPITLAEIAAEPIVLYPRNPRPSYADQVLSLFRDHGLSPAIAHEARELQIAIGLVAAEEGLCIVPESVRQSRTEDIKYIEIQDAATSPIIMSYRRGAHSPELTIMAKAIQNTYTDWGYPIPYSIRELTDTAVNL